MSEKLLTLKEAAGCLGLSEDELERLVKKGVIPAYQIGGMYLRFKEENILSLKESSTLKSEAAQKSVSPADTHTEEGKYSRLRDFIYFNDFYILAVLIIAVLFYIILKSIR